MNLSPPVSGHETSLLAATLEHLRALVAMDTRNPPRAIEAGDLFAYVRAQLPDFAVTVVDYGAGAMTLHAVRGEPRLLFNVHLDTVPVAPGWSADPLALRVVGERAIGLGACDIKGAAAALLAVAQATAGDFALLFSTDEEANDTRCIAGFLRTPHTCDAVIVAEPTQGMAVLSHRGIQSVRMRFAGHAGHASGLQAAADSALHQAVRWGAAALAFVDSQAHHRFGALAGLRFNIGRIEGGIKANVIAPQAELRFGCRALPNMDPDQLLARLCNLADVPPSEFVETFRGSPLPAGGSANAKANELAARDLADELGIAVGAAVDFWTEAALFSAAGYTAMVYGPGDIAQAHSVDEWVALDALQRYAQTVYHIVAGGRA